MLMFAGQLVKAGPLGELVTVMMWSQVIKLLQRSVTFHVRVMIRLVGQTPAVAESVYVTVTAPQPSVPVAVPVWAGSAWPQLAYVSGGHWIVVGLVVSTLQVMTWVQVLVWLHWSNAV